MRKLATIFALAVPLFAAAPAAAQGYTEWKDGPWNVYQMEPNDCWIAYTLPEGDDLTFQATSADRMMYIWVERPGWTFAAPNQEYPLRVRFGNVDRRETGGGLDTDPGVSALLDEMQPQEVEALLTAPSVVVTVRQNDNFEVRFSRAAQNEFRKCIASIGGVGGNPTR
ncbi:hypothetical protein P1X14_04425 [Sphingomonas sp. AOB5]|uniref:hypothetical protein n=1 Tax=Sphingomonas sp. AOB5 TaxID=3034017 RepID=UPI0023F90CBD|nr:hypothetical protein [Sphingomonas sp. AOB5]MDF7774483.1 hypothetical protein [Sphingomonas sp. AOB5]